MPEALLRVDGVTKRFGGLDAVANLSLLVSTGELHAVIGPNGAGKTTLVNLLSGELLPTTGRIFFRDEDISRSAPEKRSRLGIGRSYQKTNIFLPFTVWENVRLSAQSRKPHSARWLHLAGGFAETNDRAERALELAGLASRRDSMAAAMSHGEQRQLEIAMTLATGPRVLLLDEPLAGMGTMEAERIVQLLLKLKPDHAMMLVEHDMDAVFRLADRISVLVSGSVIATGEPDAIRANADVKRAYLGDEVLA